MDLKDGYLTISAAKGLDKDDAGQEGQVHPSGALCRRLQPQLLSWARTVKPEEVSAKFEDGILACPCPKAGQKALPKATTIAIE